MRKSEKVKSVECKYGMDIKDLLMKMYHSENKSLKQISIELGLDKGNLSRMLKKLDIPTRTGSEAFDNWWNMTDDEGKKCFMDNAMKSSEIMQTKESRDKLRKVMQTKEYKRKMSMANNGEKNGMYKNDLTDEHRVRYRSVFGLKQWSLSVRKRDNYTCKVCGVSKGQSKMHAHHLESFDTCIELRTDINNGVTLCNSCHNSFHNKYKGQKTTKKQFLDYLSEKCL